MGKKIQSQEPDEFSSSTTGNGSQPSSREEDQGTRSRPDQPANQNATGPRTELGKRNSSRNSVKFGIFSRATVLKGESRADYNLLLKGLRETFQPVGKFEELLVEKLATISWRHRRLLVAEGAEIRKNSEFLEFDQRWKEQSEAQKISCKRNEEIKTTPPLPNGLIWDIQNPEVLKRCIELLVELRQRIESSGLSQHQDEGILRTIYGYRPHFWENLVDKYSIWFQTAEAPARERQSKGYPVPEQCKAFLLQEIDAEIARFKQYQEKRESIESERRKVEVLRQNVPDSRGLERLLRYETSLERAFDRTLMQLERAQRMRKGQPPPPQLDVNIT
jgi:hypothetical protein